MDTHVFAADLVLGELHLDEGPHRGEELPPGPILHPFVLLDVLLHAPDGQILDLCRARGQHGAWGQYGAASRAKWGVWVLSTLASTPACFPSLAFGLIAPANLLFDPLQTL